jgi:hypothetical protein
MFSRLEDAHALDCHFPHFIHEFSNVIHA